MHGLDTICKVKQTSEHILMSYKQYKAEQKLLRNTVLKIKTRSETEFKSELNTELSLKRLLCTEKRIKATLAFLKEIKVATRR